MNGSKNLESIRMGEDDYGKGDAVVKFVDGSLTIENEKEAKDNTKAFEQAISDLRPGGTLIIPSGLFMITSAIKINKPLRIIGGGQSRSIVENSQSQNCGIIINTTSNTEPIFIIEKDAGWKVVIISELLMVGTGNFNKMFTPIPSNKTPLVEDSKVKGVGIYLQGASAEIRNCSFINLYAGIIAFGTIGLTIQSCNFHRFHLGFYAPSNGTCNVTTIRNNEFTTGHVGVYGEIPGKDAKGEDAEHGCWDIVQNIFEDGYRGIVMSTVGANITGNWFERLAHIVKPDSKEPQPGTPGYLILPDRIEGGKPIEVLPKSMHWKGNANVCASTAQDVGQNDMPGAGIKGIYVELFRSSDKNLLILEAGDPKDLHFSGSLEAYRRVIFDVFQRLLAATGETVKKHDNTTHFIPQLRIDLDALPQKIK